MDDAVKAIDAATDTLTPAFLKGLVNIEGPKLLRVRGMVKNARPWKKDGVAPRCYGKLELDGQILSFCLTSAPYPAEGERVVIEGVLQLNKQSALEIQGKLDGSWQPMERAIQPPLPDRTQPPRPLMQFLADHPVTKLGFLTTDTAWGDICSSPSGSEIRQCARILANFIDEMEFVEAVAAIAQKGVAGIVIARGGGEELSMIGSSAIVAKALLESGLPFYVAIGHSDDVVLLDKHADQCFATPSDLSHQIAGCIKAQRMITTNASNAKKAQEKLKQTENEFAESRRTMKRIEAQRDELSRQLEAVSPQIANIAATQREIAETQRQEAGSNRKLHLIVGAALGVLIVGASASVALYLTSYAPSTASDPALGNSTVTAWDQNAVDANCLKPSNDKGARGTRQVKNDPCSHPALEPSAGHSHHGHGTHGATHE
jgi:exodeoxyribonuclease VII large subunit